MVVFYSQGILLKQHFFVFHWEWSTTFCEVMAIIIYPKVIDNTWLNNKDSVFLAFYKLIDTAVVIRKDTAIA
jgi:hypothetical protein